MRRDEREQVVDRRSLLPNMKTIRVQFFAIISLCLTLCSPVILARQETQTAAQDDLKKQVGTIIVTPGNGPNLALADFVARSAGLESAAATFNQVLHDDLDFAAVAGIVGKSRSE